MIKAYMLWAYLVAVVIGMVAMMEIGYRIAIRTQPYAYSSTIGSVESSIFGLMGLLLAFTFYGAGARFEVRRDQVVQEANAIATAYRRLDLLPAEAQPQLKETFRQYVRSRVAIYRNIGHPDQFHSEFARIAALQNEIWNRVVEGGKAAGSHALILLLPSINQSFDIANARMFALEAHPPFAVPILLAITVLVASLLVGYELSFQFSHNWLYRASYIVVVTAVLSVIVDYEYPRLGLIRINRFDKFLARALENMD